MNKKVKKIISIIIIFAILSLMFNSNISSASDMKSDAKKITFGVVESGNIYASILNDKDVNYTFSLTKRTTLKFDVNWYSKLSDVVNLYVYNDAGKQVHKERALDGKIYNQYIYTLDAGIYYIVLRYIKNDYGNIGYNLKISEYNTNYLYNYSAIDCENSNEIKFNDNVKSLIYGTSVSDFTNYYKFKLEKSTPISLKTRINDAKKDDTLTIRILNDRQFKLKEYTTDPAYEVYDYMDDTLGAGEYYISVTYNKNGSDSVWYDMLLSDCNSNSYIKDDTVVNNINVDVDNVGIKLNKTSLTLKKGKKSTLKILNVYGKKITWKSSNKKVATVSAKGVVKAVKKGKAVITAKVDGKTLKCNVKVK